MDVIPAVDLLGEDAVRLEQGDYQRVVARRPVSEYVAALVAAGPPLLHIVDLDGARLGQVRRDLVARVIEAAGPVPVQVSGGVRTVAMASDLVEAGAARVVIGTAAFGETPEIYGAEHLLIRRAVSQEVGDKLAARIKWWEDYTTKNNGSMDNNPSPGNKAGGLTTILEKSLGAAAKGGSTNLVDVVEYAEPLSAKGLIFMDTPGYDPVNATGLVAGGSTVLCFTTGRGSAFGCSPTPSIKLATNSDIFRRMSDDMDVNCGTIVDGTKSVDEVGAEVFAKILSVASGEKPFSEELGYGQEEFVPWQLGAVM